nr:hypothetical protein [Tanacetum cinerariifolium]
MLKQREQTANLAVQKEQEEQTTQSFTPYWNFSMIDNEEVLQSREKFMKAIQTFLQKFSRYYFGVMPKILLIAWERFSEIKNAFTDKHYQPEEIQELMCKLLEDLQIINSSTFDVLKDHSEILSDFNNDDISSDDEDFEDIEYVEASELVSLEEENDVYQEEKEIDLEDILQIQDVILRKKLLSINRLIADIEFLNDNPTPDRVLKSSSSFPIFEKSDNSLSYSDNSLPEFETFSDHMEETRSGSTTAHANNSPPDDDSISLSENKSSNFDHHDDPSFFRPLPKTLDVEVFFDFDPSSGELISAVMNNIDELNEDECFDPGE